MSGVTRWPPVFNFVQRLFADPSLTARDIVDGIEYQRGMRVLDLGCGPGQYAHLFDDADYLGVDVSEAYIASARRRHPGKAFRVADATTTDLYEGPFDRVLVCGVFHHMTDAHVTAALDGAFPTLTRDGFVFVVDAVWPNSRLDLPGWLIRWLDRGAYVRSLDEWAGLFGPYRPARLRRSRNRLLSVVTCRLVSGRDPQ